MSGRDVVRPNLSPSVLTAFAIAEEWKDLPGERRMVAGLLHWLVRARWIGSASRVAFEVPWRGRRIDLVTINGRGHLNAFEFKLGGTRRAFEQAIYNSASVHRSFIVSGARPTDANRGLAQEHGIGVFIVNGSVKLFQRPPLRKPLTDLSTPLRAKAIEWNGSGV